MVLKDRRNRSSFRNKNFIQALSHAKDGLVYALVNERNFKYQLLASLLVCLLAAVLSVSRLEWLWLDLAICLMLLTELLNTSIETLVDLVVGDRYHPLAKAAKDLGAAMALLVACFTVVIGLLIFLPKLLTLI